MAAIMAGRPRPSFLPELPADALAELPAEVARTLAALGSEPRSASPV
jgi:hypothetical protein